MGTNHKDDIRTYQNYIEGEWRSAGNNELMESINPATGEVLARAQRSGVEDAQQAAATAATAFRKLDWAHNPRKRSAAMLAWVDRLERESEALARLLTLEVGKPLHESRAEVLRGIDHLRFYAGVARSLYGRATALSPGSYSILAREPIGVVAVIVPWNFPVTLLMRDLAPTLAAGCTTVVKPASDTPAITAAFFEQLPGPEVFPPGVINMVTGPGRTVGAELVRSPQVDMVSLTGDTETGKKLMRDASHTLKKLALELGGKSANIIFDDANLAVAIPKAISAIFTNAGQLCTAGSRLLVSEKIHAHVVAELKARVERMRVGHGLDEQTEMGPLASASQLDRVLEYAQLGQQDAELVTGGRRLDEGNLHRGFFFAPTIYDRAPMQSRLVQEEIFGPVLVVQSFREEGDAIELANATRFGLAAAVWTENLGRAMRVSRGLQSGTVWVNNYNVLSPETETGGYKESGIGRASGMEGIYERTEVKHIYLDVEQR
jgi:betaine-aldehyde dehydrogenase